jgi:hypothetical protein
MQQADLRFQLALPAALNSCSLYSTRCLPWASNTSALPIREKIEGGKQIFTPATANQRDADGRQARWLSVATHIEADVR